MKASDGDTDVEPDKEVEVSGELTSMSSSETKALNVADGDKELSNLATSDLMSFWSSSNVSARNASEGETVDTESASGELYKSRQLTII